MTNPASVEDVKKGMERPLTADELTAAATWLDRSWNIVRAEIPGVEARMELDDSLPGHLDEADVVDVLASMVERKLRNPDGRRQWGDDTYNETIDTTISSGQLYLTDDEKRRLGPRAQVVEGGIYSLQMER
ncbi:Gp19/Gp15/Gp42 family protein [Herbiconiux solani]|uniref:Gp19/Gp15/Gp42 family protein n=1 Tax=Herbiconiux solani TaxID=661329 RepID=UPI0008254664|nr:Gp19/Gp15/Gp42 family protein [Herbiconiux solani]